MTWLWGVPVVKALTVYWIRQLKDDCTSRYVCMEEIVRYVCKETGVSFIRFSRWTSIAGHRPPVRISILRGFATLDLVLRFCQHYASRCGIHIIFTARILAPQHPSALRDFAHCTFNIAMELSMALVRLRIFSLDHVKILCAYSSLHQVLSDLSFLTKP